MDEMRWCRRVVRIVTASWYVWAFYCNLGLLMQNKMCIVMVTFHNIHIQVFLNRHYLPMSLIGVGINYFVNFGLSWYSSPILSARDAYIFIDHSLRLDSIKLCEKFIFLFDTRRCDVLTCNRDASIFPVFEYDTYVVTNWLTVSCQFVKKLTFP